MGSEPAADERLCLSLDTRGRATLRMRSIRGHVDGILRMLDDETVYCVDVLHQMRAVEGALKQVGNIVLRSHLRDHVVTAAGRGDPEEIINELMEILKYR